MLISIAIPTYEMHGKGSQFLEFQFEIFLTQVYQHFEIVISDNSNDDSIFHTCMKYTDRLNIKYTRNEGDRENLTVNLNNALRSCQGDIIKILFLDDFLWDEYSLKYIHGGFEDSTKWLVTACQHTEDGTQFNRLFQPRFNTDIHLGNNTISSPSVLAIRNENILFFDEKLTWLMDCDYYKRLYNQFGLPKIIDQVCVVNRIHNFQVSNLLPQIRKDREYEYVKNKYEEAS